MGIEEQKEEREVLDSIFPDEITDISDTSYRISIALDVTPTSDEEPEPPTILLNVIYPDSYPDVGPHLDITSPPNAPKHPLIDVAADKPQLLEALQPTIEESLGMAMVFTLVTTLKDSAEALIAERQKQEQDVLDAEVAKAEEEENRKFFGTKVTKESFLEWREKFRREMEEQEQKKREEEEADEKKKGLKKGEIGKLTGRQLWERGLAKAVEEEEEEEVGQVLEKGVEELKVSG